MRRCIGSRTFQEASSTAIPLVEMDDYPPAAMQEGLQEALQEGR